MITRARASLISQFLDDANATHLLFIDADIGFEPEQVLRLVQCGAEVCAAVYPVKRIDWDKVKTTFEAGGPIRRRRHCNMSLRSMIRMRSLRKAGFVKVRYAGTGFLMIRRRRWKECARSIRFCNTSATIRSTPRPRATSALPCSNA